MPVEREESIIELCRQAVESLAVTMPEAQLSCHVRIGDALRIVAVSGSFHLIYEVRRGQGGICWRAVETGEPQLVENVRLDPDYLATDERVQSEIAVPVPSGADALVVLDAEFAERAFTQEEAGAVLAAAAVLERALGAGPQ